MSDEIMVKRDPLETNTRRPSVVGEEPSRIPNRETEPMLPLFSTEESQGLRSRWENLQVGFVDEPRQAVEQADRLVTEAINELSKGFSSQREKLEQQWHREQDVSTEDLRLAFRRYRSFFERLLSM